jgi:hypothetical protein
LTERLSATTASTDPNGANNLATATIDVFQPIVLDVSPRDDANIINLNRGGVLTVAVVTTPTFDATTVRVSTVCFGDAETPTERACIEKHGTGHFEDVNKDGRLDLLLH